MKSSFCLFVSLLALLLSSCHSKQTAESEEDATIASVTPVTIDTASTGAMSDYLELNAVSSFLKKNSVKAPASGYIRQMSINIGDLVKKDQELAVLKTKEASALDNLSQKDSTARFSGLIHIRSFQDGIISAFNKHVGDFVQEGDDLCILSDQSSFVFLLDVPFELHSLIHIGSTVEVVLPDHQVLPGTIYSCLPSMDVNSQTESFLVRPSRSVSLPENLIARIRILKAKKEKAVTVPRTAILSNEAQTEFWVMKLINDSVAVKTPIHKGLETDDRTEIMDPVFKPRDRFLISGNYGLADTAKVVIEPKRQEP
jgi:hypothetical protein